MEQQGSARFGFTAHRVEPDNPSGLTGGYDSAVREYLSRIDRCLAERAFSDDDSRRLASAAERLGISRFHCESLHREYFGSVVVEAGIGRRGSRQDLPLTGLMRVGHLLDLPLSVITGILETVSGDTPGRPGSGRALPRHRARIARLLAE